eukprot:2629497-Rhodomonas_salina.2
MVCRLNGFPQRAPELLPCVAQVFHCITGIVPFAKLGDPLQVIVNEICTKPVPDVTVGSQGRASGPRRSENFPFNPRPFDPTRLDHDPRA